MDTSVCRKAKLNTYSCSDEWDQNIDQLSLHWGAKLSFFWTLYFSDFRGYFCHFVLFLGEILCLLKESFTESIICVTRTRFSNYNFPSHGQSNNQRHSLHALLQAAWQIVFWLNTHSTYSPRMQCRNHTFHRLRSSHPFLLNNRKTLWINIMWGNVKMVLLMIQKLHHFLILRQFMSVLLALPLGHMSYSSIVPGFRFMNNAQYVIKQSQ